MAGLPWVSSRQEAGLRVLVRTLDGVQCEVWPCQGWTAHDLKCEIEEKIRVPAARQRLLHDCRVLQDDDLDTAALSELPAADSGAGALLELTLLIRSSAVAEMLEAVQQSPWALATASEEVRGDKEVVTEAVRKHGMVLQCAADELRGDRDVVTEAIRKHGTALQYAADKLRSDRGVVTEAIKQYGRALRYAVPELRADEDVVTEAVRSNGWALQFAASELRGYKGIVTEAVRNNGWALQFAAEELRRDKDVVIEAVKQSGWALQFAADNLRSDRDVVAEAVKQSSGAVQFAVSEPRGDACARDRATGSHGGEPCSPVGTLRRRPTEGMAGCCIPLSLLLSRLFAGCSWDLSWGQS